MATKYVVKSITQSSTSEKQFHMFVGRWQPLHDGHKWLFQQALDEDKNVLICIRDVEPDEKNIFTPEQVKENIETYYQDLIKHNRVKVIIIPDIDAICYGRGVGYDVIEYIPPTEIHDISATKIREEMKKK